VTEPPLDLRQGDACDGQLRGERVPRIVPPQGT
jgi:hypothetical protein